MVCFNSLSPNFNFKPVASTRINGKDQHSPIREHLAELEQRIEDRIAEVNRRIVSGENKQIKNNTSASKNARVIAAREGIPIATFYWYLQKLGINQSKRLRSLKEDFFEQIDHELKAYLLG
jgi:hypothetical protein